MDAAGWHKSDDLIVSSNISILMRPYAPELNPVENSWQDLRRHKRAHRLRETDEAVTDACCGAWKDLIAAPDRIRFIATREWANMS